MSQYTALLDANVLYPAPLRDLLLELSVSDLFRAKWTAHIHHEWIESLLQKEPHRNRAALERTRDLMDRETRDSLVTGYEGLISALTLPDPDDRHVLAAAIVGRCDGIITQNLKDFPKDALAPFGIETLHPDVFLCHQLNLSPSKFCMAVRQIRARLKNPPYSIQQYFDTLAKLGLHTTIAELAQFKDNL